jgi:hydrophobic/amphiphilic exporter-1 (mainly G- bacteria), HAE1 family
LSAIPTFAFMDLMDFTLNQITLLGLSLVAGVLVDDAIVEIENIVRHMRMGKSGFQAALDAADEIGLAVVATSFTIIAVFLPVSFMSGITGQYFKQFGLTVAAAVFISLLVARLITPVLAAYALKPDALLQHPVDGPIMTRYLQTLRWVRREPLEDDRGGVLFSSVALALLVTIPQAFVPPEDFASASSTSSCRRAARSTTRRGSPPPRPCICENRPRSPTSSNSSAMTRFAMRLSTSASCRAPAQAQPEAVGAEDGPADADRS